MNALIEEYYKENYDHLVKILSNRAGGVPNAEDVVQEAFYRALRYKKSFSPDIEKFSAWFNKILNNALRQSKMVERRLGMSVEYNEEMDDVVDLLEWEEDLIKNIKRDVSRKNTTERQVLQLYLFHQYKPREIEQVLDISNAYIRTIAKDFKKDMRKKYGEEVLCLLMES